jgi:hypothetical protein
MEIRMCPYCNSQINLDRTWEHSSCEDFTQFVLEDLISKARRKLEILLLKKNELIILQDKQFK